MRFETSSFVASLSIVTAMDRADRLPALAGFLSTFSLIFVFGRVFMTFMTFIAGAFIAGAFGAGAFIAFIGRAFIGMAFITLAAGTPAAVSVSVPSAFAFIAFIAFIGWAPCDFIDFGRAFMTFIATGGVSSTSSSGAVAPLISVDMALAVIEGKTAKHKGNLLTRLKVFAKKTAARIQQSH
jgi:hypothetical protein